MSPEERREFHEAAARQSAKTITASTDDRGAFRIDGIGEGMYWLQSADRDIRLVRATWFTEVPFSAGDYLDLLAMPILRATFELTMDTGEAVTSAGIRLKHLDSDQESSFWWRPDSRVCEVSPGAWKISATAGPNQLWHGEREVVVPESGLKEPVRIDLKGEDAMVVRARPPRPFYSPAFVWVLAADKVPAGSVRDVDIIRLGAVKAVDNNWSSQPLRGLTPGRYTAFCCVPGGVIYARAEFEYAGGRQWFDFEIPAPARDDHVVVRALDPDGGPLMGAMVVLDMDGSLGKVEALPMRGGEYWLPRRSPQDLYYSRPVTATEYRITAEHARYGKRVTSCPLTQTEVEVRFSDTVTLAVKLENLPADRRDFRLAVYPAGTDGQRELAAMPPERQGGPVPDRSEFRVQPGRLVVALILRWGGSNSWPILQTEVDVTADREFAVAVPPLSTLKVHLPGATASISVSIRGEQGQARSASTVDERVEFANLSAGTYTIGTADGAMAVRVPYSGELKFEPRPYNCLVLWQFDSGGVLGQAGMRLGDKIRAINGRPLEGTRAELHGIFQGAGAQGDVTLTIARGAQTLTLNIPSAQWRSLQNAGTNPTREE